MTAIDRLVVVKMSMDAVPRGGGMQDALRFLRDKDATQRSAARARVWAFQAIAAVRQAAHPNPWISSTDEEIAAEILRRIDERKKEKP